MSTVYTIYRATNIITQKVYIGFDSSWPKRRQDHKAAAKFPDNNKFYNAIRKYGWDAFIWEVIYQSLDYDHCLEKMEPYFIVEHDSLSNGYNTDSGGTGGHKGASWWNNGTVNSLSIVCPGPEYVPGRLLCKGTKGTHFWNNGIDDCMSIDCPGPGWVRGRLATTQKAQSKYNQDPKLCHVCNSPIPYDRREKKSCSDQCSTAHRKKVASRPRKRQPTHPR